MALSQVQCLDDNHVNPRTHESKPEFFYCEDQRLALERLLRDGREAFDKYLEARGLRGFLSDPELETLVDAMEPYDPGSVVFPENAEGGERPLSLQYWPELSDTSVPHMDLGWPDSDSYRGVTRTTVYTQPPLDGQAHIKEIVRKMIAQAQKVIAVVMDVFTDVDIFRDLLDAGFKRKVSVYVLLEHTTLPHFLSMCQRANMHSGHLKHLRVRCTDGTEFYTRSCTKVKGRMGHRFMFIDGDKAVSGSYSFTWMSSRLDRNLITVVTGQAVDAFDRLFRFLYVSSSSVDLREVATEPEPEPEPLPQPAAVVLPSAALARKLHNPKYALVAVANPTPSADHSSPKEPNTENSKNPDVPETNKRRQKRASKEATQDAPPLHPGLVDLEKACLIAYLPTWPEPDPPSDVIGFINIRDAKKPTQVHLQRSEMFETSQAIRFSSPITVPKETLPEVAKPRQLIAKHEEKGKLQPTEGNSKAGESLVDGVPAQVSTERGDSKCKEEAAEQKTPASGKRSERAKDTTENNQGHTHSLTLISQDAGHSTTPPIVKHMLPQSDMKTSSPNNQGPSDSSRKPESPPGSNTEKVETNLNTQSVVVHTKLTLESNSTQSPHIHAPSDSTSNTEQHTPERTGLSHTPPQNSSEMPPYNQAPTVDSLISTSSTSEMCSQSVISTSLSDNNHIPVTANLTPCAPLSSIVASSSIAPVTNTSTTLHPPLPPSSAPSPLTPTPPIPKPRTVHLVIKYGGTDDGQNLQDIGVGSRTERLASTGQLVHSKLNVANVVQTPLEKEPETLLELHNRKMGPQEDSENTGNPEEEKQSVASHETKSEETVGLCDNRAEAQAQPDALITDAPKAGSENIQEMIPKEADPKSLISTDCKITSKTQTDVTATIQTGTEAPEKSLTDCEIAQVPNEENNNVTQHKIYHPRAQEAQRMSRCEINPQDNGPLQTVNSLKASTHTPVNSDICNESAPHTDSKTNIKHNMHTNTTSQESSQQTSKPRGSSHTPERPLRLYLSDTHIRDLRSPTPERELWALTALARTPTPDGFPSRTPTPDSQMHTPDTRSHTPDFQTPTPDVSDGYASLREDSTLSTTSEEYYECSDSPSHDPVSDYVGYRNQGKTEDHVSFTHTDTPNATTITTTSTSPACINNSTHTTMFDTADRNNSSSETKSLIGPAKISSSTEKEEDRRGKEKEETVNDEKGRNVAERRTEQDSHGTERKGNGEAKRTSEHLKQGRDLTDIVEKVSQPQAPKRKKALNNSATESLDDKGVTQGAPTNEGTDPKQPSTGVLKPDNVSSEGERPDKEMVDKAALRPGGVDKRDRPQSARESGEQKVLHTPPKLSQGHQQLESRLSSPSRRPRPPRPLSATQTLGTRPSLYYQLTEGESKVLHSSLQVSDNTSFHSRSPSRQPPPLAQGAVGTVAGQKQVKVPHSQHSLVSQQPLAAQGRARVGQSQNEHPYVKPQSSFLLTHSNIQSELRPHSQNQTVTVREAHKQEEGTSPFTITFGRLYSLKGLKDKMSKLPAQSKRGSTSSPLQGHKSTS